MPGEWTSLDDTTWRASTAYGFVLFVPVVFEAAIRFKKTKIWYFVLLGILFNFIRISLNLAYCELLFQQGFDTASYLYFYYKSFETLCYITAGFSLYYRKHMICPSKTRLDFVALCIMVLFFLSSWTTCMVSISSGSLDLCWQWGDLLTGAGLIISCAYFDVCYSLNIYYMYKNKSQWNEMIDLVILSVQTGTNSIAILVGVIVYTMGYANFYTNAIWNFVVVIAPIISIQSVISPKVARFLSSQAIGAGAKGEGVTSTFGRKTDT